MDTHTALEIANDYILRGWRPIPVPYRKKLPIIEGWQKLEITTVNAAQHFNGALQNIGVVLGPKSNGLTDIDLDCPEAIGLAPHFLPITGSKFGRASKPVSHLLYKITDAPDQGSLKLSDPDKDKDGKTHVIIELRMGGGTKGAQTVFPGSVHESGEPVEWSTDGEVAVSSYAILKTAVTKIAAATLLIRSFPSTGSRHDAALALGGFLARAGWSVDDIRKFVEVVARAGGSKDAAGRAQDAVDAAETHARGDKNTYGLPGLITFFGKASAEAVATWLEYHAVGNQDLLLQMNNTYSVVKDGGKVGVLTFDRHVKKIGRYEHVRHIPSFLSFGDLRNLHLNQTVIENRKSFALGSWWLQHPERQQYAGIIFEPGGAAVIDDRLNLWKGFGIVPQQGDWSLMREHIKVVMARSVEVDYSYIFKWLAWAVQNPAERAEVALVFKGKRGTGKGTLGNCMCRIFGQHAAHISSADHMTGRFNFHLRDACFLFADEAYWPGDKRAEGNLKRLITEPDLFIEKKGHDIVPSTNMLHPMIAGNDDWLVPAGEHERRYAPYEVSDKHIQKSDWFDPLYAQLDHGGYGAMLFDLLNYKLEGWHPRSIQKIVASAELVKQQQRSLSEFDAWWVELLETGTLEGADPLRPNCAVSNEYTEEINMVGGGHSYTRILKHRGLFDQARSIEPRLKHYAGDHMLGRHLSACGCDNTKKVLRRQGWTFPSLSECRKAWEARFPGWVWRDSAITEWRTEVDDEPQAEQEAPQPQTDVPVTRGDQDDDLPF
jgi:hypothetical protein